MRSLRTRLELAMCVGDAQDAQDDAVRAPGSRRQFCFCDVSDYSAIGCVVAVDDLVDVVGHRYAVDWLKVQVTMEGEEEEWYRPLP